MLKELKNAEEIKYKVATKGLYGNLGVLERWVL